VAEWIATICSGVWAAVAIVLSLTERPGNGSALSESSFTLYRRLSIKGVPVLIGLIFLGSAAAIYTWIEGRNDVFLYGALILLVMFPLSAIFVMPYNRLAMEHNTDALGEAMDRMFRRWWLIHVIRTVLALIAFVLFVGGLSFWAEGLPGNA